MMRANPSLQDFSEEQASVTTRESIIALIEKMPEPLLPELYELIKNFEAAQAQPCLMSKLRSIEISAPPDFSQIVDLCIPGEKVNELLESRLGRKSISGLKRKVGKILQKVPSREVSEWDKIK